MTYGAIVSPLGDSEVDVFRKMSRGDSGVSIVKNVGFKNEDLPLGRINDLGEGNRFQQLLKRTCSILSDRFPDVVRAKSTKIIISTTKADIEALPNDTFESSRELIRRILETVNQPLIVSNACISGILAINTAADYIRSGKFDHVVVIGIDALSDFVTFGFQSLFAISTDRIKPFDKNRSGINIGEAAAAVVLSKESIPDRFNVAYLGGSSSNDANHISGPSRTGEGLVRSVNKTLQRAGVETDSIDFISAHGTGTLYNDEMESIAFDRLGMNTIPLNSLKGYFGHTLGAAGVVEVIVSMKMMEHNLLLRSLGFSERGTSCDIAVLSENLETPVTTVLKTGSGFGGGNASLVMRKTEK